MVVARPGVWQPDDVAFRTALGRALYRVPPRLRSVLPQSVRDRIRRRSGPFAPWEAGFDHRAPALGPREKPGPPDFVGIGVQKAGTTWWFRLLVEHPSVYHRDDVHKERHYFARYATRGFGPEDIEGYHAWFPRIEGTITGEWTPDYAYQAWVPALVAEAAPDARLLLMVRDPVERFLSGLAHDALLPASHAGSVVAEAIERGFYAASLRRWLAGFDAGQILVLQYERCVADPGGELARTYAFMGVDPAFRPADLRRPSSPTRRPKTELDDRTRGRLADMYAEDVSELVSLVPALDVALWPNFTASRHRLVR